MHSLRNGQWKKHTRVRLERRPHTRWDWLGVAIIIAAAFIAANFVLQEKSIFDQTSTIQNFLDGEQKESLRTTIQHGR